MLKKVVIAVVILFVLAVIVLGWDKTTSYISGTRQVLHQEVDDRTPMRLEKARIEVLISQEQAKLVAFEDKVAELEGQRDIAARSVEEARRDLAAEMELLKRIKALLDEEREHYTIGRATYSFAEVNADALERLQQVERMQEAIAFHESLLTDLDAAIRQGASSLGEARKRLTELKNGLARLEQRNVNAEIREQVAQLANAVAGAPLSADSELEKAMRNYERRIGAKERRATARLSTGMGQFRIDYSSAMVTQDAASEIDRLLSAGSAAKPVAEARQARPLLGEVLEDMQE